MSAFVLISTEKSHPVVVDRPSESESCRSPKARSRFAPIDQLLSQIDRSDELRACA